MALSAGLAELQAEARCPLCLDTLREPVTLDCGHNCCDSCLQQRWEHLLDTLPCPVCQHRCPRRNVKRNSQLALLADLVRQLPGQRVAGAAQEPRGRCDAHQQPLSLFCEEDLELLCGQCGASAAHRGHALTPMGQAAAHHRRKLKGSLERLQQQLEEAERSQQRERAKSREVREKVQKQRKELLWECKEFKDFLGSEQRTLDNRRANQLREVFHKGIRSREQLARCSSTLSTALQELAQLRLGADGDLLAGLCRAQRQWRECEGLQLPATSAYSPAEQARTFPPHHIGLQNMMSKFQVDLTLDPDAAHPGLRVSPDRRTVVLCHERMQLCTAPARSELDAHVAVLGALEFQGGRFFWQVEVSGMGVWTVGVCKDFSRKDPVTPSPESGFWELVLMSRHHLSSEVPVRVGIFLDYDLGQISFYDMNNRAHVQTITGAFTGKLHPYFSVRCSSETFHLSVVRDEW